MPRKQETETARACGSENERCNHVWSYEFGSASIHDERALRMPTLLDEHPRESLSIRVSRRLNSHDVIDTLAEAMVARGVPEHIRSDNVR